MQALWGISDGYKAHHYLIAYLQVFQADISGMRQGLFLLLKAAILLLRWLVSGDLTIWSIWALSVFWKIEEVHRYIFALVTPSLGLLAEKRECLRAWSSASHCSGTGTSSLSILFHSHIWCGYWRSCFVLGLWQSLKLDTSFFQKFWDLGILWGFIQSKAF